MPVPLRVLAAVVAAAVCLVVLLAPHGHAGTPSCAHAAGCGR